MRQLLSTASCLALAGLLGGAPLPAMAQTMVPHQAMTSHPAVTLIAATSTTESTKLAATDAALRDLWMGHIFWVRAVVEAAMAGNTAMEKVAEEQAVANAHALAASVEPFYGKAGEDGLFKLLAGHYGAIKAYLTATMEKSTTKQSEATTALTNNAEQIADFLAKANPHINKNAAFGLLQAHAGQHIEQIQQFEAKDYAGEAKTWAAMVKHVYVISDVLANALAEQFPSKF